MTDAISVPIKDAAEMLGLSQTRLRELADKQLIESRYEGRKRLVSVASLQAYFKSLPTERETKDP